MVHPHGSPSNGVLSNMPQPIRLGLVDHIAEPNVISVSNIVSILQNCRRARNLESARHLHAQVCSNGLEASVGNYIVPLLVECGSVFDAHQAFNRLPCQNECSWTSLMLGYIDSGQPQHAFNLYKKMQDNCIHPSGYTLTALLRACAREKNVEIGRQIHDEVKRSGYETDTYVGTTLVDMYAKCGSLMEAQDVFDNLPVRNVVSWTALIAGYAHHGSAEKALECLEEMQVKGMSLNILTLVCGLKACGNIGAIDKGRNIHRKIAQLGFEKDISVANNLIDMYVKCGSLAEAHQIFNELSVRNAMSWNILMAGYSKNGFDQKALKCFDLMQLGGISPDAVTFVCSLKACGKLADLEKGRKIQKLLVQKGYDSDMFVGTTLIDMYAKCGSLVEAQQAFDSLRVHDVVSWNALIAGYAENGLGLKALKCFDQMHMKGIDPNAITFICCLKACAGIGAIDRGREIHIEIAQKGFGKEICVANSIISMYARCGSIAEARGVFDQMKARDVESWNSLILGYFESGYVEEALERFQQMQLEEISPNANTLVWSLKCCGSLGALLKGREIHVETVQKRYEKDLYVGNNLIDMYVKCGSVGEGKEVFDKLPVRDAVSWAAIISGCYEYGSCLEALKCLELMEIESVVPDNVIFLYSLKACGIVKAIAKGRRLHAQVRKTDSADDIFVGTQLMNMYAKCGLMRETQNIFDRLHAQDTVSWNTLILGYSENGQGLEAIKCFDWMQRHGIHADNVTLVCILKACSSIGAIEKGQQIHTAVAQKGLDTDIFIGNTLVAMYAKCGLLRDAKQVFNKLEVCEPPAWTAMIGGHADYGSSEEALNYFEGMQHEGMIPDIVTYVSSLRACCNLGILRKGRELHAQIIQFGYEKDIRIGNALVNMYVACGSMSEAEDIFDKLPTQNLWAWTAIIAGYAENGLGEIGIKCFEQMQLEVVTPDVVTYIWGLKACGSMLAVNKGREMHAGIVLRNYGSDLMLGTTVIEMYLKCGSLAEAHDVFDRLPSRDVVTWGTLITGFSEKGYVGEVFACFEQMQLEGVQPNAVIFVGVLRICGLVGALFEGRKIHAAILQQELLKDLLVGNTLVDMYARCGSIEEALEVFDKMPVRDILSWTAVIMGYTEEQQGQEVLNSFWYMSLEGVLPDAFIFASSLRACASLGAIDKGREIHNEITEKGFEKEVVVATSLIDMYFKCGSPIEAHKVFVNLQVEDVALWNAMIKGYGLNFAGNMAVQCFEDMQEHGVNPDAATFTCLLAACGRASLVVKGHEYFKVMQEKYGIMPTEDHYTCMVDLLARSGYLIKAEKLLETVPCPLSKESWTAMLGACKIYGETELGLRCFKQVVHLDPKYAAPYLLLENIYASSGMLDNEMLHD